MTEVSNSQTPLRASFRIILNGEPVAIETIDQAYRFITSLSTVEWMEATATISTGSILEPAFGSFEMKDCSPSDDACGTARDFFDRIRNSA